MEIKIGNKDLIKTIEIFSKESKYAHITFETYFLMKYGNKEWEQAYKVAPAFFSISIKGMLNESLLTIAKLFEKNSDNNLFKLLNIIDANQLVFKSEKKENLINEVRKYRVILESKAEPISKIKKWRDKLLAHYDNEFFTEPQKIGDDIGLSAEEIRDLIHTAHCLLNSFSCIITGQRISEVYYNYDDIKYLIGIVLKSKSE